MKINFLKFKGDKRIVNKSFEVDSAVVEGTFKLPLDLLTPVVDIDISAIPSAYDKKLVMYDTNYAKIYDNTNTDWHDRYYYIVKKEYINDKMVRFYLEEDVLKTFKDDILNQTMYIDRSESQWNTMLEDNLINYQYGKKIEEAEPTHNAAIIALGINFVNLNWIFPDQPSPTDNELFKFAVTVFSEEANNFNAVGKFLPPQNLGLPPIDANAITSLDNHNSVFVTEMSGVSEIIKMATQQPSEIGSFIGSIWVFPFALTDTSEVGALTSVKVGSIPQGHQSSPAISLAAYPTYHDNGLQNSAIQPVGASYIHYIILDCWDTDAGYSYRDYEPYTKYELYLPFIGYVEVDANLYLNRRIWVMMSVSLKDGSATMYVYSGSKDGTFDASKCRPIYTKDFQIGINIPFSSSNKDSQNAKMLSQSIAFATGEVTSLGQALIGGVSGSNQGVTKGLTGLVSTAGHFLGSTMGMVDAGSVKLGTANTSIASPLKVRIRKTTYIETAYQSDIRPIAGLPCKEVRSLAQLTGMTIISNPIFSSFSFWATETEKNEISKALQSGVIL